MPSKTRRQARTMLAAANDAAFAKRMNIPQDIAREYVAADQAKKKRKR